MSYERDYPKDARDVRWFATLGSRLDDRIDPSTGRRLIVPGGVEGEITADVYDIGPEVVDQVNRDLQAILGEARSERYNLNSFFDVRDFAKQALGVFLQRHEEAGIEFKRDYKPTEVRIRTIDGLIPSSRH
jgi:hypothetical protein